MSISDFVVLGIVALAMLLGFWKGIVRTLLRIAELIVSAGLAGGGFYLVLRLMTDEASSGETAGIADLIVPIAVGAALFILSMIVFDFIVNKYIYRKGHMKGKIIDHLIGMLIAFLVTVVVIYVLVAFIGTFASNYVELNDFLSSGKLLPLIYDFNPFTDLMQKFVVDSGVKKSIIKVLDMFWPTFEYLN